MKSAAEFYNLGHAAYRDQNLGDAVAAFLTARDLRPRDPDTLANLEFLRTKLQDQLSFTVERSAWDTVFTWAHYFSAREWFYLWGLVLVLVFVGLNLKIFWPQARALRQSIWAGIILFALSTPAAAYRVLFSPTWGAIKPAAVEVYSGPATEGFVTLFQLHAGAPLVVLEQQGDWSKILLSDGKKGWVANSAIQVYSL